MKSCLSSVAIALCLLGKAWSQDAAADTKPTEAPTNIRIELQVVAIPEAQAVPLASQLMDKSKIEAAYAKIQDMLEKGSAKLIDWPILTTKSGQRAIVEGVNELRYATEYSPPVVSVKDIQQPERGEEIAAKVNVTQLEAIPTAFETRNVGVTLEVEPISSKDGKTIDLNIVPQHVHFKGYNKVTVDKPSAGGKIVVEQPEFDTMKVTTSLTVRSGQRTLMGMHRTSEPANHIEFFILKVEVLKVE